jgi:long-chain acyl-CoA synthetase
MTTSGDDGLHERRLTAVLAQNARISPDHTAVICGEHRASYREVADRVDRLVSVLRAHEVRPGSRVLWHGHNCHRVLECLLACARLGAIFSPLNWRWSSEELSSVVEDAAPTVVVWQLRELGETSRALPNRDRDGAVWICHDDDAAADAGGYETLLAAARPDASDDGGSSTDPVVMFHTAAFDGRPNGALLSQSGLVQQAEMMGLLEEISAEYTYLNCGPLFHIATVVMTLATLRFGGTNVFVPKVEPEALCEIIEREQCNGAYVLGPTAEAIAALNADGHRDLSSLRVRTGVAAFDAMTSPTTSRWSARPGGYGQTEAGGLLTYRALGPPPMGSHGRPSPHVQLRVVDPEGRDVAPGTVGEIIARSPSVMVGYWNRPELTAERQVGGWHHTDDLGRLEDDGSLTFVGPMHRIVKSASENIYPAEVEACLVQHPAVSEVAVIGVPDPVWTQSVKAIVVVADGHDVQDHELIAHCRSHLASYKKPRFVEFVDALPRRDGRIDYARLDAEHGGGGYPGEASARYPT